MTGECGGVDLSGQETDVDGWICLSDRRMWRGGAVTARARSFSTLCHHGRLVVALSTASVHIPHDL